MNKLFGYAAILATANAAASQVKANNLLGIDVSAYQGTINWTAVHGAGVVFAFAQATEGNYFQDSKFKSYMTNGKAAGIEMGAAHFSRPDLNTPATEANYFWNFAGPYIKADGKSISPAVEFETFNGHVGTSTYTAWFNAWAAAVKAKTTNSMAPVIYLSTCATCNLDNTITLGGWLASYNGENVYTGNPWSSCISCNPWGQSNWVYWQCSSTGSIPGITGNVDLDAFNGTLAKLKSTEGVGGL